MRSFSFSEGDNRRSERHTPTEPRQRREIRLEKSGYRNVADSVRAVCYSEVGHKRLFEKI